MKSISLLIVAFLAVGSLLYGVFGNEKSTLPSYGSAPLLTGVQSLNGPLSSEALHGKISVVHFFFTSCQGVCPTITGRVRTLVKGLDTNPEVQFLSLSIDPERDSLSRIEEYAQKLVAPRKRWNFLVTEKEKTKEILDQFRLAAPEDVNNHTTRLVLLDRSGEIRGYYRGLDSESVEELRQGILQLLG